jgi:hypothetical protein
MFVAIISASKIAGIQSGLFNKDSIVQKSEKKREE